MNLKKKDSSPAEIYATQFENPEPSHYTRIPQILKYLTYDSINPKTGKKTVKRLSLHARVLYEVLKSTAGDHGRCWKNRDHLAEECNMSAGSVTKAKKELSQAFHQLEGNPLIIIEEKQKNITKEQKAGKTPYHLITICDIWKWNRAFMATAKYLKREAPSPHDRCDEAPSPYDEAPEGALSPHDTNKIPINNIPLSKEQHPTAVADSVCFSEKEILSPPEKYTADEEALAVTFLRHVGFSDKVAANLMKTYSYRDLVDCSRYCKKRSDKNKANGASLSTPCGYYINCLQNRYWEKTNEKNK